MSAAASKPFDAILFDLDGTLIHLPQEDFSRGTTMLTARTVAPALGQDPRAIASALVKGVEAMIRNDGSVRNDEAFYRVWDDLIGSDRALTDSLFTAYYRNEFRSFKSITTENPFVFEAMAQSRRLSDRVILATLPVFPEVAQIERLSWIGLSLCDFDLVTDYSNCRFSKPNPAYFREIFDRFSLDPSRCLMVGNDVSDDILPALSLGMQSYLVTDCLLNGHLPAPGAMRGSFSDFVGFLHSL